MSSFETTSTFTELNKNLPISSNNKSRCSDAVAMILRPEPPDEDELEN